ncbi:MAG: 2-C-methyl-D-erythritol 2,4-cyclodiphosphate synthase [Candidatus Omnitrophica bacterium]|nr:2-C-methyl-D-erythritol 2,4-cyclodiphosphate synthase [Candidatus Omnitrophota bacterium]MDE2008473.1 2-C-methyl-D-erythritol 2,4-cyclodiphosphate synthase [Candidatus Omnitrophota bacterium]
MDTRVGIGHDVHRLTAGARLVLGGIEVPHTHGLVSHSDGDVVLHAVCDAILGAAGMGDIGEHFPDTDARYKGMASSFFLKEVNKRIHEAGWAIGNVDVVILAQEPKLKEFKPRMKAHIAGQLDIAETRVNIKAGTHEGLGYIGAKEGIAAYAVVLLKVA